MKQKLLLYLFLAIFSSALVYFFPLPTSPQNVPTLVATTNVKVFIQPQAGHTPLLEHIQTAQKEILVAIYLLSDKQIIAALQQAADRGVTVKVLLEEHPFGGGNLNKKTESALKKTKVLVKWSNPAFALTHEKALIIDSTKALILNQNLTASAFTENREYAVVVTDPVDVAQMKAIFISDWDRKTLKLKPSHLLISPYNSRQTLTSFLKNATQTIDIVMEVIDDEKIETMLSEKAQTTQIRLLLPDFKKISANKPVAERLQAAGISVHTLKNPYLHAKLILVDQTQAYIGSVNFTTHSLDKNREAGILLSEPQTISRLQQSFEADWQKSTAAFFPPGSSPTQSSQ